VSVSRRALPLVAGLSLAGGMAACGSSDDQPAASTAKPAPAAGGASATKALTVDIASFKYAPPDATVAKGARVTFVNKDKAPHTATAKDGAFDTKRLEQGGENVVTLDTAGTFSYFCEYHRFMEAKITVK